jgi:histidyl-tRNA synthetase
MCQDCQRRAETNPLRVLDCKVPEDQPLIDALPTVHEHLCATCAEHFSMVRMLLDDRRIAYTVKPRLVRGLDYYMRTTFEYVHTGLGAQNSVLGGGRYDGLAEQLGSKVHSPGIGFSIGEDRLVMTLEQASPEAHAHQLQLFIAPMGAECARHAAGIAHALRAKGVVVELGADAKLKRSMEIANKQGAQYVLLVGDNERTSGQYVLKNMASGEQKQVSMESLLHSNF